MSHRLRCTLLLFLTLVLLGPVTVETNATAPGSESWSDALAARVATWLDRLRPALEEIAASHGVTNEGNIFPNLDPDGLSDTTDQGPDDADGNTFPNLDPNG